MMKLISIFSLMALLGSVLAADPKAVDPVKQRLEKEQAALEAKKKVSAEIRKAEAMAFYKKQKVSTNVINRYDLDHNGVLDEREMTKWIADVRQAQITREKNKEKKN